MLLIAALEESRSVRGLLVAQEDVANIVELLGVTLNSRSWSVQSTVGSSAAVPVFT